MKSDHVRASVAAVVAACTEIIGVRRRPVLYRKYVTRLIGCRAGTGPSHPVAEDGQCQHGCDDAPEHDGIWALSSGRCRSGWHRLLGENERNATRLGGLWTLSDIGSPARTAQTPVNYRRRFRLPHPGHPGHAVGGIDRWEPVAETTPGAADVGLGAHMPADPDLS